MTTTPTSTEPWQGLILHLFRSTFGTTPGRNALHGVDSVTLVGCLTGRVDYPDQTRRQMPEGSRVFPATVDRPAVMLRQGAGKSWHLVPAVWAGGEYRAVKGWFMAGGTFASDSDSRWPELLRQVGAAEYGVAVQVHDWREW